MIICAAICQDSMDGIKTRVNCFIPPLMKFFSIAYFQSIINKGWSHKNNLVLHISGWASCLLLFYAADCNSKIVFSLHRRNWLSGLHVCYRAAWINECTIMHTKFLDDCRLQFDWLLFNWYLNHKKKKRKSACLLLQGPYK